MTMRATTARLLAVSAMTLIATTVILGASTTSFACSCGVSEPSEAFERSDAVFVGEIEEVRRPEPSDFREREARYIFSVGTVFKGDVYQQQSVVTHADGATCGMEISGPGRFLMFATTTANDPGGPAPADGELASALCSGNTLIDSDFSAAQFGDGFAPLAGSSPTGSNGLTSLAWGGLFVSTIVILLVGTLIGFRGRRRAARPG